MLRRGRLFPLIKAEWSVLYCVSRKGFDRFDVSSQGPLDILDPIMGPMSFVIYDIYQINCHTEKKKWWPVSKTNPHIIFILLEKRSGPTRSEGRDKTSCRWSGQTSVRKKRSSISCSLMSRLVLNHSHVLRNAPRRHFNFLG